MKTTTRTRLALIVLLFVTLGLLPINAGAFIMVDDAVLTPDMWMNDFVLHLTLSIPAGQGLFAIAINDQGGSDFELSYAGIAEYYALYAAVSGTAITPAYAQNNTPLVANYSPGPFASTVNIPIDESIFLGYWDDRAGFDNIPTANDNYGWVELQNTMSGLTLVGGATAIGGGIYAGTYTQIPEPSTIALACSGAIALLLRTRRKHIGRK